MPRSQSPSFVLTLKLNTSDQTTQILDKRFLCGQQIYNCLVRHVRKQLARLYADKEYQKLLSAYQELKGSSFDIKKKRSLYGKQMSDIRLAYGLSEYALHKYVAVKQHRYRKHIDSMTAQKTASSVWKAVEKVLFGNGNTVHFRRHDDFNSMEGKTNASGIRYVKGRLVWNGLEICIRHRKDAYETEALRHRVKYCRIIRRPVGTKNHYYLQLVLEGIPPVKHSCGTGRTGIDIGPSTAAVYAEDGYAKLDVLAREADTMERKKRMLQRKLDRSRRACNPGNYHPDGTVKKRCRWKQSGHYKRVSFQYRVLCRKRAATVRQSHERLANEVLSHGTEVYVEQMSFAGLAKKSGVDRKRRDGRPARKKRFGHSIGSRSPSMFLSIIDRKLHYEGRALIFVNTQSFKASQYDHMNDSYQPSSLNRRYKVLDGKRIQRDLYSAFLLMNSNDTCDHADRQRCFNTYDRFLDAHDRCIRKLKTDTTYKYPSSMGLKYFAL